MSRAKAIMTHRPGYRRSWEDHGHSQQMPAQHIMVETEQNELLLVEDSAEEKIMVGKFSHAAKAINKPP